MGFAGYIFIKSQLVMHVLKRNFNFFKLETVVKREHLAWTTNLIPIVWPWWVKSAIPSKGEREKWLKRYREASKSGTHGPGVLWFIQYLRGFQNCIPFFEYKVEEDIRGGMKPTEKSKQIESTPFLTYWNEYYNILDEQKCSMATLAISLSYFVPTYRWGAGRGANPCYWVSAFLMAKQRPSNGSIFSASTHVANREQYSRQCSQSCVYYALEATGRLPANMDLVNRKSSAVQYFVPNGPCRYSGQLPMKNVH